MMNLEPHTSADVNPFLLRATNSSRHPSTPVDAAGFDKNASHYDMSDHKYLIILNHHWFEKKHFKKRPSMRNGTYQDERCLRDVFHELGFTIIVLRNFKYKDIIDRLKGIVDSWFRPNPTPKRKLEKIKISCVCVAILTHGDEGGQIRAVDQLYKLNEIMEIFGKEPELTNKPKLYFVQACRGGNIDAGHTVNLGTQSEDQLQRPSRVQYSASGEVVTVETQPASAARGDFFSGLRDIFRGCGGLSRDPGDTDLIDSHQSLLTVPSHAALGTQSDGLLKRPATSHRSRIPSVQYSASEESAMMQTKLASRGSTAHNDMACSGDVVDAGYTVKLGTKSDGELKTPPRRQYSVPQPASRPTPQFVTMPTQPASMASGLRDLFMGCGDLPVDLDDADLLDSQNECLLTVPSYADTLVVCSTVEEFLSYRDDHGSWMIQALCESIQKNHKDQNLLDMIIEMHRTVAYDKITYHTIKEQDKKKQMPETRFTLTKHLKF